MIANLAERDEPAERVHRSAQDLPALLGSEVLLVERPLCRSDIAEEHLNPGNIREDVREVSYLFGLFGKLQDHLHVLLHPTKHVRVNCIPGEIT